MPASVYEVAVTTASAAAAASVVSVASVVASVDEFCASYSDTSAISTCSTRKRSAAHTAPAPPERATTSPEAMTVLRARRLPGFVVRLLFLSMPSWIGGRLTTTFAASYGIPR